MANFNIFSSAKNKTDTRNEAGGRAYALSPEQQLAHSPRPAALTIPFMLPLKISWNKSSRLRKKSSHYLLPKRLSMHANAAI